ncbi:unnamed protein product [Pieris brassicae]|uniref:Uncharacterized protein n=1 Tax=Pieris brassicae TaxID=7116 RepID=A0A9P0TCV2_PIEBR|nr:unnamed protein product [Pieris brassicae]
MNALFNVKNHLPAKAFKFVSTHIELGPWHQLHILFRNRIFKYDSELGETMSVPSGQENTAAQKVYSTPNTSNRFYTQNTQTHPDATVSEDLFLNNDYWKKTSNNFQANNVYPTNSQMDEIPFNVLLPSFNSLIGQDNGQYYFQDNGTNTGIQQDISRLEEQNRQDRPLIQPINTWILILSL